MLPTDQVTYRHHSSRHFRPHCHLHQICPYYDVQKENPVLFNQSKIERLLYFLYVWEENLQVPSYYHITECLEVLTWAFHTKHVFLGIKLTFDYQLIGFKMANPQIWLWKVKVVARFILNYRRIFHQDHRLSWLLYLYLNYSMLQADRDNLSFNLWK